MTTRSDLKARGAEMRRRLFGDDTLQGAADGSPDLLRTVNTEATYGAIWSRPGLALDDRMVCALAALAACQRLRQFRRHAEAALKLGLSARAIVEIAIQIGIYAGFTASEDAIEAAREVFIKAGAKVEDEGPRDDSPEALSQRGADLMKQLHGDRATQGYAAPGNDVTGALYPLAIQYGYGEIWFRPGLDLRRRALVAVAAFTALKLDGQVKKFGQSALNMGLSRTEVIEAIIQTAPLTGFAPALNALGGLGEALS